MNYDSGNFSNNSAQPIISPVNQPQSQTGTQGGNKWHALAIISTVVLGVVLLAASVYLGLAHRQREPRQGSTYPTLFPTVIPQSISPPRTTRPPYRKETYSVVDPSPLYPGVQWEATKSGKTTFRTISNELVTVDGYSLESSLLSTYPEDFLAYYEQQLVTKGWELTEFAEGPSGECHAYQKNRRYIRLCVHGTRGRGLQYKVLLEHN